MSATIRPSPDLPPLPTTVEARWAESHAPLVERIRDEIVAGGPITFARFMELVLYAPGIGYYARGDARTTRGGDFLTAPELHPIFGRALANQVVEAWERLGRLKPFIVREDAAGTGSLGLSILDGLTASGAPIADAVAYLPIEASDEREAAIRARLAAAGHGARLADAALRDAPIEGLVLANELLDALPVHRLTALDGSLVEIGVGWRDGWFADTPVPEASPRAVEQLAADGVALVEGQVAVVGVAAPDWVARLGTVLSRGLGIVIDYGHAAAALYDPATRREGLLRTYHRHHAGDDPYRFVGEADLTAHVDWTAVERAATGAGLEVLGRTTQGEYLASLGLGELLISEQARPGVTAAAYAEARAAVVRLIDPRAMGGFSVLALGRGIPTEPPLRGLAFRLPALARP